MDITRIMQVLGVAESAAIASAEWNGLGDKNAADQAATTAMREAFNQIDFDGQIVIGEGERDEAPMLYIGEKLGRGGEAIDIAVDPLEGTNLCAANRPNALTTIAIAPRGALLFAPDTYMNKLAAGPACRGKVHIDQSPAENIQAVATCLDKPVSEVNVCVLERERHQQLIADIRAAGARVRTIDDGDVFGAIATALPHTGIDLYLGSGGSPEGVLACTGLKAIGGVFMGRFDFGEDVKAAEKRERAEQMVAEHQQEIDLDGVLTMDDLVRSDQACFIASGVTAGELVDGVRYYDDKIEVSSVLFSSAERSVKYIRNVKTL
ncbi:MAG: class II fructose-bisphosphatase [Coriobacteriales bacterium]|jgi:fructose-1,6-bisphosphatase class II|nr:class II fructose-bisphosphatase [Coriobacteriales bacterium]